MTLFPFYFVVVYRTMLERFQIVLQTDRTVRAATFGVYRINEGLKAEMTDKVVVNGALVVVNVRAQLRVTLATDATGDQNDTFA